jgi:hypothetical protein
MKAGDPFGISRIGVWEHFDGDVPIQLRVVRAIHLTHPSGADEGEDLVNAKANAGREAHW